MSIVISAFRSKFLLAFYVNYVPTSVQMAHRLIYNNGCWLFEIYTSFAVVQQLCEADVVRVH